ncbi:hypothetical protein ACEN32_02415 [Marinilactibacillus psychrotolerans]|uniref:hypothetical protein n=1 Tax=Marinilactibacillus psychrotolerans TaxID=191770 RepID=UPI0038871297
MKDNPDILTSREVTIYEKEKLNLTFLDDSMTNIDNAIFQVLTVLDLPTDNIVTRIDQRSRVFKNLEDVIGDITTDKSTMHYISKFIAAAANGLFDASLNYLWNATINELRSRIVNFDVEYFFNVTVNNPDKRETLDGEKDLSKIQDADLLMGAKKIELIEAIAYEKLVHINYMRNNASTAHPNNSELSGMDLISYLSTCIDYIFNMPSSEVNIEIKKLLQDIKNRTFSKDEIRLKVSYFGNLSEQKSSSLIKGLFGIYVNSETSSETRDNITQLAPSLWSVVSDEHKKKIGIKYGTYSLNGDEGKASLARSFLEVVEGQSYIPKNFKVSEISNILADLRSANRNNGNFYTEPPLAKQLKQFILNFEDVPEEIEKEYIHTLVSCYITNSNGIAWNAEPDYEILISKLSSEQANIALLSFVDNTVQKRLYYKMCSNKFLDMLNLIENKVILPKYKELLTYLKQFNADHYSKFLNDITYKRDFEDFVKHYS